MGLPQSSTVAPGDHNPDGDDIVTLDPLLVSPGYLKGVDLEERFELYGRPLHARSTRGSVEVEDAADDMVGPFARVHVRPPSAGVDRFADLVRPLSDGRRRT